MKNQKGITLIALVITIIVLLILAGVSIAMLTGDNGVLTKSRQSKADNELGAAKDQISLLATEATTQYYEDTYVTATNTQSYSGTALQSAIMTKLNDSSVATTISPVTPTVNTTNNTITLTYNERQVVGTVDANGRLTWGTIEKAS